MSTNEITLCRFTNAMLLFSGVGLILLGSNGTVDAVITSQGSIVTEQTPVGTMLQQGIIHAAAVAEAKEDATLLFIGMLVVLFALGIYTLMYIRKRETNEEKAHKLVRFFWMEVWR
jgi:hypothetical protein